jgi:hypothetical protein
LPKYQRDGSKKRDNSTFIDLEDVVPTNDGRMSRPKGHKASEQDMRREASSMVLESTLKALIASKEEAYANEKKGGSKC